MQKMQMITAYTVFSGLSVRKLSKTVALTVVKVEGVVSASV